MSNLPIPSTWGYIDLGTCATVITKGSTPTTYGRPYTPDGIAFVRVENLSNGRIITRSITTFIDSETDKILKRSRLQANDILFSIAGTIGRTALVREEDLPANTNQALAVIRGTDRVLDPTYLSLALVSSAAQHQAFKEARGGAMNNISLGDIRALSVPVPPLLEQRRIVAEIEKQFTRLDAAVEALKRVRANLKRYRASVLKAACEGRLVPTEAELARAESRDYEPADVLLEHILKERRAKWAADQLARLKAQGRARKDDKWKEKYKEPAAADSRALPNLPEGWVWARWEQVGLSQNGQSFPSKEYQATGIKLLRPGNLHPSGRVSWTPENTRRLPAKWATDSPQFIVGARELVINLTAQSLRDEFLGRVCITHTDERCLLNQRIARITPIEVAPEYLLCMFKSSVFRRFVNGLNTGSLIQHMFTSQLADFCLPLPPLAEQGRIVAEAERRLSLVDESESLVEANLKRVERLRQSILKRAFEGKLVPQDPNDEPASVLLERIRAERKATREPAASRERRNTTKKKQP